MVCSLILTQVDEIWKNVLKKFEDGRRPQNFSKWKTTSKKLKMEDDLNFLKMEDDLNFFENGRRPHFLKMEDDLKK